MIRQAIVVLGIGSIVAGLAPVARAQSSMPSGSGNNSATLSSDSLQIEGRTVRQDFRTFFNNPSQTGQRNSQTNIGRLRQSPQSSPLNSILGEDVDLVFGDTLNSQRTPISFPATGDAGDGDRVKLQLQLGQ